MLTAWLEEFRSDFILLRTDDGTSTKDLYFKADRPIWTKHPELMDFAAVALAQYAAHRRMDLHIKGSVTRSQLDNIAEFLNIWSIWKSDCFQRVTITCDNEVNDPPRRDGPSVLAFSSGVDSSYSLLAHNTGTLGRLAFPVGLGVLIYGWDIRHGDAKGLEIARTKAEAALQTFGSECVVVETNWQQEFCPVWFLGFNAGVACVLQTLRDDYSCAVFSNGLSYLEELSTGPFGSHIAANYLLGSTSFPFLTCGGLVTRLERIEAIAKHPVLMSNLRVCYQEGANGTNCCHCEKCTRTQLEFIATGVDPSASFAEICTEADVDRLEAASVGVLAMLEELLQKFPTDHPLRPPLINTVERARQRWKPTPDDGELAVAREQIEWLYNSTSWRVTAPMRWLKTRFSH